MKNKKRLIFYIFWGLLVTLFFLYRLFPANLLKQALTSSMKSYTKDVRVDFKDIKPALPPGLKLFDVDIFYHDAEVFNADYVKLMPGLFSLIFGTKKITVDAASLGGNLHTAVTYKNIPGGPALSIKADIEEVQLEKLPVKDLFMGYDVKGSLDLKGEWDVAGQIVKKGEMEILLKTVNVAIKNRMIGIDSISFDTIEIEAVIKDNRVEIQKGDITGKETDGTVTGFIDLKIPFESSGLDLKGTIKPRPEFMKAIGKKFPVGLLFGKMNQKTGIPFSIGGTLSKPAFAMDRQPK